MTTALLLARSGYQVRLLERESALGGLWATRLDTNGHYQGENSCKVFQASYCSAPALFQLIGTNWKEHFIAQHDLKAEWLDPFLADCSWADLMKIGQTFALFVIGFSSYQDLSVEHWLKQNNVSESCQTWFRATALGAISGTLRMTVWEFIHRFCSNLDDIIGSIFRKNNHFRLFWNKQPPNAPEGFVSIWHRALEQSGVKITTNIQVTGLEQKQGKIIITTTGDQYRVDAVFLAVPPPALSALLTASSDSIATGFGHSRESLETLLRESVYQHLGLAWFFDQPLRNCFPLGGHNIRNGWHPIMVEHSQYARHLEVPAVTVVVASVSVDTELVHPVHGTRASDHSPEELAQILWEDERRVDPTLPKPIGFRVFGISSATQLTHHGALPVRASSSDVFIATNMNGQAAYFTSSLESAIQAGAAAAAAFDPCVERLPIRVAPTPWKIRLWLLLLAILFTFVFFHLISSVF